MKRLLSLWLTLLAAFWCARSCIETVSGTPEPRLETGLAVVAIPALQALALAWLTRGPGPSPVAALVREVGHSRLLASLLAADLLVPALALGAPDQVWLQPALGEAFDGNPTSILAAGQALGAGFLFLRWRLQSTLPRPPRLRRLAFAASLTLLAGLLAIDSLTLVGEEILPQGSPLQWRLTLHAPALAASFALLFMVQGDIRSHQDRREREAPSGRRQPPLAATALDTAAASAWLALLLSVASALFESPPLLLVAPNALFTLFGTTALVAAGLTVDEKQSLPRDV